MKRKTIALVCSFLVAVLLFAMPISAAITTHATVDIENMTKGYQTALISKDSAIVKDGFSALKIKPYTVANGVGSLGDTSSTLSNGAKGNGARRTELINLTQEVAAGTYSLSLWVADPEGTLTAEGADFAILLSFHNADSTDDSLKNDWCDPEKNGGIVKVLDLHDHTARPITAGSKHWDKYSGTKSNLSATDEKVSAGGVTWMKYTGTVTITETVAKVAFWLYQWTGYNNQVSNEIYFEDVTLFTGTEDTTVTTEVTTAEPAVTTTQASSGTTSSNSVSVVTYVAIGLAAAVIIAVVVVCVPSGKKK